MSCVPRDSNGQNFILLLFYCKANKFMVLMALCQNMEGQRPGHGYESQEDSKMMQLEFWIIMS